MNGRVFGVGFAGNKFVLIRLVAGSSVSGSNIVGFVGVIINIQLIERYGYIADGKCVFDRVLRSEESHRYKYSGNDE